MLVLICDIWAMPCLIFCWISFISGSSMLLVCLLSALVPDCSALLVWSYSSVSSHMLSGLIVPFLVHDYKPLTVLFFHCTSLQSIFAVTAIFIVSSSLEVWTALLSGSMLFVRKQLVLLAFNFWKSFLDSRNSLKGLASPQYFQKSIAVATGFDMPGFLASEHCKNLSFVISWLLWLLVCNGVRHVLPFCSCCWAVSLYLVLLCSTCWL